MMWFRRVLYVWISLMLVTCGTAGSDLSVLIKRVDTLEKDLSSTRATVSTQEHKYAAIISNILNTLSSTTKELHALKQAQRSAIRELTSVKDDIKVQNQRLHSVFTNVTFLHRQVGNLHTDLEMTYRDISTTKSIVNHTISDLKSFSNNISAMKTAFMDHRHAVNLSLASDSSSIRNLKSELLVVNHVLNATGMNFALFEHQIKRLNAETNSTKRCLEFLNRNLTRIIRLQTNLTTHLTGHRATEKFGRKAGFQVQQSRKDYLVNNTEVLTFDVVPLNPWGAYNKTTGKFTAPTSGTYLFWASVTSTTDKPMVVSLYKNAKRFASSGIKTGDTNLVYMLHVNRGDELWFIGSGYRILRGSYYSSYGGVLLYPS